MREKAKNKECNRTRSKKAVRREELPPHGFFAAVRNARIAEIAGNPSRDEAPGSRRFGDGRWLRAAESVLPCDPFVGYDEPTSWKKIPNFPQYVVGSGRMGTR